MLRKNAFRNIAATKRLRWNSVQNSIPVCILHAFMSESQYVNSGRRFLNISLGWNRDMTWYKPTCTTPCNESHSFGFAQLGGAAGRYGEIYGHYVSVLFFFQLLWKGKGWSDDWFIYRNLYSEWGVKVSATIAVTDTIAKRAFFGRKIISVDNQDYRCFLWLLRNRL